MGNHRGRIWIDPFQTRLAWRQVFYCLAFLASAWVIMTVYHTMHDGLDELGERSTPSRLGVPALTTIFSILALIAYDAIRFVHRLIGPIHRIRGTVQALAAGEPVDLVRLRDGDFLQEFAEEFNDLLIALDRQGAIAIKDRQLAESKGRTVCPVP